MKFRPLAGLRSYMLGSTESGTMKMFYFDFIGPGKRDPIETESAELLDAVQAQYHCRSLFEGRGMAMGALYVQVRDQDGPILYSWPEERIDALRP